MSEPTPAQVLAAKGEPITLVDGTVVHVRYSFRSIAMLEERFGSLPAAEATLRAAYKGLGSAEPGAQAHAFRTLWQVLTPGLIDARYTHPETGQLVRLGQYDELVGDLLDPAQMKAYNGAFARAISQAFGGLYGQEPAGGEAGDPPAQAPAAAPSPGTTGTTSPSSSPADPTPPSGA